MPQRRGTAPVGLSAMMANSPRVKFSSSFRFTSSAARLLSPTYCGLALGHGDSWTRLKFATFLADFHTHTKSH